MSKVEKNYYNKKILYREIKKLLKDFKQEKLCDLI